MTQLLSLASELLSLTRKSPHLGYIERDSVISQYEEEYFRLSRLVNEASATVIVGCVFGNNDCTGLAHGYVGVWVCSYPQAVDKLVEIQIFAQRTRIVEVTK